MMMKARRNSEAAMRFEDRKQRERTAQRLNARVPTLATLRLDIDEGRGAISGGPKYARIITVATSPALFDLGCSDPSCRDGGHDLTSHVLRGLLEGKTHFALDQRCEGSVGSADCGRTMHVEVSATYH